MTDRLENLASQLSVPGIGQNQTDASRKPERKTFLNISCGDLSVYFGSIQWPDRVTGELGDPSPQFYARVRGYNNANGYPADIAISDSPEDLRAFAAALNQIASFVEESGLALTRSRSFNQIEEARNVFKV